jgi:hypothetical protein
MTAGSGGTGKVDVGPVQVPALSSQPEATTRTVLALVIVTLFVAVVIGSGTEAYFRNWFETWFQTVFPAVTGLIGGAVVGYYFGQTGR